MHLFSKKRQTSTTLCKPSIQESSLRKKIAKEEHLFCGACLKEIDSNYMNDEVNWIQCDIHSICIWMYLSCAVTKLSHIPVNNNIICVTLVTKKTVMNYNYVYHTNITLFPI